MTCVRSATDPEVMVWDTEQPACEGIAPKVFGCFLIRFGDDYVFICSRLC